MNFVALRMLVGDRAKYYALIVTAATGALGLTGCKKQGGTADVRSKDAGGTALIVVFLPALHSIWFKVKKPTTESAAAAVAIQTLTIA